MKASMKKEEEDLRAGGFNCLEGIVIIILFWGFVCIVIWGIVKVFIH